jgi:CO dehydrogenase maturation factor
MWRRGADLVKVAFVGKGGAGKSAIAGTFARALARRGEPVLTIDSDPMPGLAFSLGLERSDTPIPEDAVVERKEGEDGPRFRLRPGLNALEAVELYAATAPDGVRFLQFGKLRGHSVAIMRSQFAFMQIIDELPADAPWSVIGDLPGGTRQPFAGWGDYAETFIAIIEPTAKGLLAGRRLARLAARPEGPKRIVAVANKVRENGDDELVERRTGLQVIGSVPYDEAFAEAERQALAPIDHAPDSLAVRAVESLVSQLCEERQP